MPVYNGERYLKSAIESILEQTFSHFEFIVINDGSTDSSSETIRRYSESDKRIRFIDYSPNKGVAYAVNLGLEQAKGKWIAITDCDDVSKEYRFERQLEYLNAHPEVILLGSDITILSPFGEVVQQCVSMPRNHEEIDQQLLVSGWPLVSPSTLIRADALRRIGGFRQEFGGNMDHDLFLRLAEIGKLENLGENLFCYRLHLANRTFNPTTVSGVEKAIESALSRRKIERPDVPRYKAMIGTNFEADYFIFLQCKWALIRLLQGDTSTWQVFGRNLRFLLRSKLGRFRPFYLQLRRFVRG